MAGIILFNKYVMHTCICRCRKTARGPITVVIYLSRTTCQFYNRICRCVCRIMPISADIVSPNDKFLGNVIPWMSDNFDGSVFRFGGSFRVILFRVVYIYFIVLVWKLQRDWEVKILSFHVDLYEKSDKKRWSENRLCAYRHLPFYSSTMIVKI